MEINLTGYTLLDNYGTDRIKLKGIYTKESLIKLVINEWVPYVECDRKCFRSDFCGFVKKDPNDPERTLEIKCEVGIRAIRNFISYSFNILTSLDEDVIQNYLDALYYYYQMVFFAETTIGGLLNERSFEFLGQHASAAFGFLKKLRNYIDEYSRLLKVIPDFRTKDTIIFVEGESEKTFLNKLKATHFYDLLEINVISYDGGSNRRIRRIEMLLRDYRRRGYEVYIQGDADGSNQDVFRELEKRGLINDKNKFIFRYDFESSIPPLLLYYVLKEMNLFKSYISEEDFINILEDFDRPIIPFLSEHFNIDLRPIKVRFAEEVANILVKSHLLWGDNSFLTTELGKFIVFVRVMY